MRKIYSRAVAFGDATAACFLLAATLIAGLVSPAWADDPFKTLYKFDSSASGDQDPFDQGVIVVGGVLYGVTAQGGRATCTHGCGLVYSLTPTSNPTVWKKTNLHVFGGGRDGFTPMGKLVAGPDGSLYGVTANGGASAKCGTDGCGTVYKLTPGASWTKTVLYNFAAKDATDGKHPRAGLVMDASGKLYGNTQTGGSSDAGIIFMLSPPVAPSTAWTETRLLNFDSSVTGKKPDAPLTRVAGGKLYGVAPEGGAHNSGTVFELVPPASKGGAWTFNLLRAFAGAAMRDGHSPTFTKLIFGPDGAMYGTTQGGGPTAGCDILGCGIVFRFQPPAVGSKQWVYSILHRFHLGDGLGRYPMGGVVMDADGNLYGSTYDSGAFSRGILYKLTATTGTGVWPLTKLHDFDNARAERPSAPLTRVGGFLYGTTAAGAGSNQSGTVFRYGP